MRKRLYPILLILPFLLLACSQDHPLEDINILNNNNEVANLLNNTVNIMQENSMNRNSIDWVDFRQQIFDTADGAESVNANSVNSAFTLALQLLGDNHSLIVRPNGTRLSASTASCPTSVLDPVDLPNTIGYIKISAFQGLGENGDQHADDIQEQIRVQDHSNIIGWIVDLRNNTGGSFYPMLAGVGPILGEGMAGNFIYPNDVVQPWSYVNGSAKLDEFAITTVSEPYELLNPNPKVAVLINGAVASSGEGVAISFIGRENTQFFGTSSCGLSTGNAGYNLTDGTVLALTVAKMADRNLNVYGESLTPDNIVSSENIIQAAVDYLNN